MSPDEVLTAAGPAGRDEREGLVFISGMKVCRKDVLKTWRGIYHGQFMSFGVHDYIILSHM